MPPKRTPKPRPAPVSSNRLKIKYEDEHLIVAWKQHGLPTISTGRTDQITAYSILMSYMKASGGRIFIVHRLDRDTSGLLVFAKDERTKRLLQDNWNEAVLERKYQAVVEGCPEPPQGRLVGWLRENPKSLKVHVSHYDNGGKIAITNYRVKARKDGFSLLELELETGRKNQIRAQLADAGYPVAGDKKYGSVKNPLGRLALHAATLAFIHPYTGKVLKIKSTAPFETMFIKNKKGD